MPSHRILALAVAAVALPLASSAAALSPDEQRIVAYVDAHSTEFAADLEAAVQIDSATENLAGVRQMGEFFRGKLAALGFAARFADLPAATLRAGHLVAERKGTQGRRVLLIGHLDTVYPGANYRREGNIAHGAGVADMKGGDVVLLHALQALAAVGALEHTQIIVVFSGDEEAPGKPLAVTRKELLEAAARSDLALAFESAIGKTGTIARRGSTGWELEVQGATGHSSGMFSAAMGSGSVYETARILQGFHDALRAMDGVTANPAMIAGGADATLSRTGGTVTGKANIVAQRTLVRGDLRTISAEQLAEAQAKMQAIVAGHLPRTSAILKFDEGYPAMPPTERNSVLLAQLSQVSQDLGYGEITAFDPRGRGAGDVSFVSPPLAALDGLGLGGQGEHTTHESTDLTTAPELVKRAALLIYRLTR
jgi:glutamate carboxypeptidase